MSRAIVDRYEDPVDRIWLATAARLGWQVDRSREVYASWDGEKTLSIADPADYDPDDSVAQLVLHEICHALVQGPARRRDVDWGLNNEDDRDALAEHACHRLQAALADRHGLRTLLGVTTDWRSYWDAMPEDTLADVADPATQLARAAWEEATRGPWAAAIEDALRATAAIRAAALPFTGPDSRWR